VTVSPSSSRPRPWPVTVSGLLILGQGGSLLILSAIGFATLLSLSYLPWLVLPPALADDVSRFNLTLDLDTFLPTVFLEATLGLTLALFLLLNGLRVLQRRPQAWTVAMLFQGLSLALLLSLYLIGRREGWIFLWMSSSILTVWQLNRADVVETFEPRPAREAGRLPTAETPGLAASEPESLQ